LFHEWAIIVHDDVPKAVGWHRAVRDAVTRRWRRLFVCVDTHPMRNIAPALVALSFPEHFEQKKNAAALSEGSRAHTRSNISSGPSEAGAAVAFGFHAWRRIKRASVEKVVEDDLRHTPSAGLTSAPYPPSACDDAQDDEHHEWAREDHEE
jgi:hypothetical protein